MADRGFVDYYEVLQLSPSANEETVERVYRLLAKRYHPDNQATGDAEKFTDLREAYVVVSDPEKRASYDSQYDENRSRVWQIFEDASVYDGPEHDRRVFHGILSLLYVARRRDVRNPGLEGSDQYFVGRVTLGRRRTVRHRWMGGLPDHGDPGAWIPCGSRTEASEDADANRHSRDSVHRRREVTSRQHDPIANQRAACEPVRGAETSRAERGEGTAARTIPAAMRGTSHSKPLHGALQRVGRQLLLREVTSRALAGATAVPERALGEPPVERLCAGSTSERSTYRSSASPRGG